jgi:hypothetical protein
VTFLFYSELDLFCLVSGLGGCLFHSTSFLFRRVDLLSTNILLERKDSSIEEIHSFIQHVFCVRSRIDGVELYHISNE